MWVEKFHMSRPTASPETTAFSKLLHINQNTIKHMTVWNSVRVWKDDDCYDLNSTQALRSVSRCVKIPTFLYLKVLWSLPRSSSRRADCQDQPGPPSVSLQSQDLRYKYPTSTAMSPLRSDRSLHLGAKHTHQNVFIDRQFSPLQPFSLSAEVYLAWVVCVLLS